MINKKFFTLATIAILSTGLRGFSFANEMLSTEIKARYLHQPDLAKIIFPYLNSDNILHADFLATVAKPSAYLTDFYSILAIADVSKEDIIKNFVPIYASLTAQNAHSFTLSFLAGFDIEFFPNSSIELIGQQIPFSHALISGKTWQEKQSNLNAFIHYLHKRTVTDKYLLKNPAFASEQIVQQKMYHEPTDVIVDPDLRIFENTENAVLLMPEKVRGVNSEAKTLVQILASQQVDWLGLAMLNTHQQPLLNKFNNAQIGSADYLEARKALLDYFASEWNGQAAEKTSGEKNYYFKLIEFAHFQGIKLIALEHATLPYLLFRYGESNFGTAVRSLWWAEHIPQQGKGVIFGGSTHFNQQSATNVQDFIAHLYPERSMLSLTNLKPPALSQ